MYLGARWAMSDGNKTVWDSIACDDWRGQAGPLKMLKGKGKRQRGGGSREGGSTLLAGRWAWDLDSNPSQSWVNSGWRTRSDLSKARHWLIGSQGPVPSASQWRGQSVLDLTWLGDKMADTWGSTSICTRCSVSSKRARLSCCYTVVSLPL